MNSIPNISTNLTVALAIKKLLFATMGFLKHIIDDAVSSLYHLSKALPFIFPVVTALSAGLSAIIHTKARAKTKRLLSEKSDEEDRAKTLREIQQQQGFRLGGNVLIVLGYVAIIASLAVFSEALPVILASITFTQIISIWRLVFSLLSKNTAYRRYRDLYSCDKADPEITIRLSDTNTENKPFDLLVKSSLMNKFVMAVLNLVSTALIITGLLIPPVAVAMAFCTFATTIATLFISVRYQNEKGRLKNKAIIKFEEAYSNMVNNNSSPTESEALSPSAPDATQALSSFAHDTEETAAPDAKETTANTGPNHAAGSNDAPSSMRQEIDKLAQEVSGFTPPSSQKN